METSSSQYGCACDPHIPCFLSLQKFSYTLPAKGRKLAWWWPIGWSRVDWTDEWYTFGWWIKLSSSLCTEFLQYIGSRKCSKKKSFGCFTEMKKEIIWMLYGNENKRYGSRRDVFPFANPFYSLLLEREGMLSCLLTPFSLEKDTREGGDVVLFANPF